MFEAFARHAVAAAEVATIGDADAEIVKRACACVGDGGENGEARAWVGHANESGCFSSN